MDDARRIVVTGLGAISPLGVGVEATWKQAISGVSGIGLIEQFDTSNVKVKIGGECRDFDPEAFMDKKDARRMDRFSQLFLGAVSEAISQSGLDYTDDVEGAMRAGIVVGTGIGGIKSFEEQVLVMNERGPGRISPYAITSIIGNMAGGEASIAHNLRGPNTSVVTACAASANAIGDAAAIIARGDADVMVAGGCEAPLCEFSVGGFSQTRALTTSFNDNPEGASRPFDLDRSGFVMSEGAAVVVLEDLEHALLRDAPIFGEIAGYGMSADAYHITLPRPGGYGAAMAMKRSLEQAGVGPSELDYINAHGTSTSANDATETAAIKFVLGDEAAANVAVSSTKSMTGHMLGAAGAIEAIMAIKSILTDTAPPTINYETPDPECDLDYVPNVSRSMPISTVMSNSFGFGGHNVSLVFREYSA